MKELIINNVRYASYKIKKVDNKHTIFIRIHFLIVDNDLLQTHKQLLHIIQLIEKQQFLHVTFENL